MSVTFSVLRHQRVIQGSLKIFIYPDLKLHIMGNLLWGTLDHTYGLDWTAKSKTNLAYNLLSPAYDILIL